MPIFLKRILVGLAFGILAGLLSYLTTLFLFVPMAPHETVVYDGDIIQIAGNSPIIISLFSTDSTEPTILTQNDTIILITSPGVMNGYYEVRSTILPGEYHLKGSTATLSLSENATVSNPGVEKREMDIRWFIVKMMFVMGTFFALLLSPVYPPENLLTVPAT